MLKSLSFINEIKVRFLFFNPLKLDKVCHGARRSFDICSQEDASCLTYEKFLKNARPRSAQFYHHFGSGSVFLALLGSTFYPQPGSDPLYLRRCKRHLARSCKHGSCSRLGRRKWTVLNLQQCLCIRYRHDNTCLFRV